MTWTYKITDIDWFENDAFLILQGRGEKDSKIYFQWSGDAQPTLDDALNYIIKTYISEELDQSPPSMWKDFDLSKVWPDVEVPEEWVNAARKAATRMYIKFMKDDLYK